MVINHNISALNTYNQLSKNEKAEKSSLEKLSSGLRINSAADDAAGLAISQKMQAQINGLDQASRNAQDGISLVQTAEGSMNEVQSIMQRMNELANQAANDTNDGNGGTDRGALNQEFSSLRNEINRIADQSQFNGKNVLDGTYDLQTGNVTTGITPNLPTASAFTANDAGAGKAGIKAGSETVSNLTYGTYTLKYNSDTQYYSLVDSNGKTVASDTTDKDTAITWTSTTPPQLGANFDLKDASGNNVFQFQTSTSTDASGGVNYVAGSLDGLTFSVTDNALLHSNVVDTSTISASNVEAGTWSIANGIGSDGNNNYTMSDGNGHQMVASDDVDSSGKLTFVGTNGETLTIDKKSTYVAGDLNGKKLNIGGKSLTLQVGANEGDTISMSIANMTTDQTDSATAMKALNDCDISTQTGASNAITTIQNAVDYVSTSRASLGAYQNRLDHTINNLTTESQNLTSASSSITDVDMAQEMMNYSKNNILNQAAQAMLAQANQLGSGVLSLLKG